MVANPLYGVQTLFGKYLDNHLTFLIWMLSGIYIVVTSSRSILLSKLGYPRAHNTVSVITSIKIKLVEVLLPSRLVRRLYFSLLYFCDSN